MAPICRKRKAHNVHSIVLNIMCTYFRPNELDSITLLDGVVQGTRLRLDGAEVLVSAHRVVWLCMLVREPVAVIIWTT